MSQRRPLTRPERSALRQRGIIAPSWWCCDAAGFLWVAAGFLWVAAGFLWVAAGFLWVRSMGRRRRWVPAGNGARLHAAAVLLGVWGRG